MDNAVSIERRLAAMKAFHDAGVRTTCFISPIFPGLTDLPSIIHRAKNQCNLVWLENLNLRGGYKKTIFDYITEKHPDLLPLYDTIYNKKERSYWSMLDAQMRQFCQEEGLLYVRDDDSIKRPFNDPPIVVNYFFHEEIIPRPKCRRTGNQNYIVTCRKLEVVEVKSMNTQIIAIANQKGGVGKTTTCANLGIGLAQAGKKVLLIDGDPQGSLTISLGNPQPDKLPFTLSDAMGKILMDQPIRPGEGILHHAEGVDLMPADIQLSGMEVSLVNAMSRETVLRQYLDTLKGQYSHILIDCQPSLGMLTVNALAAANRIIIPVQAEYLPAKGLEQLLSTVSKVKRQINPKLQIDGILLTMVDNRTNFAKEIAALLRDTYGSKIKVFGTEIPHSVRAKEISAEGKSIFAHDPGGKVAEGYRNLTKEVLKLEKQREKNRAGLGR